ncbi:hypothetical protein [Methanocella sp. MCL-LM]|uniref:hypothetical protein n=1 Tax=Methanocella sp. MCL-LM TaxID=3412035 RepID=UPI003C734F7B
MRISILEASKSIKLIICVFVVSICIIAGLAQAYQILPADQPIATDETSRPGPLEVPPPTIKPTDENGEQYQDDDVSRKGSVTSTRVVYAAQEDSTAGVSTSNGSQLILIDNSCKLLPDPANSCNPIVWPSNSGQPVRIITTSSYDPVSSQYDIMASYKDYTSNTREITITLNRVTGGDWTFIDEYTSGYDGSGSIITHHFTGTSDGWDSYLIIVRRLLNNQTCMEYYCNIPSPGETEYR